MLAPFQEMSFISTEVKLVLQYPKSKTEITNLRVSFCVTPGIKKASITGKSLY